jgi:hypothetical protein
VAEIILAAGIELEVRRQLVAVLVEKAHQAAPMIEMAVADDERAHLAGIGFDELDVVEQRLGAVAIIEHDGPLLVVALRLQVKRQSPLIVQGPAEIRRPRRRRDAHAVRLVRPEEQVVAAVDEHADRQLVHHRRLDRRRTCNFDAAEAAGGRRARECRGSLEEIASSDRIGHGRLPPNR